MCSLKPSLILSSESTSLSSYLVSNENREKALQTSHQIPIVLREKVMIFGDAAVGKTTLINTVSNGRKNNYSFPKQYLMTTSVELNVVEIPLMDNKNVIVDLFLYDIPGQYVFKNVLKNLKTEVYFICIYDVSSRKSLQSCLNWIQHMRTSSNNEKQIKGLLVANKIDLREGGVDSRSEVSTSEGQKFAKENELEYFECSAFTRKNIDNHFQFIAQQVFNTFQQNMQVKDPTVNHPINEPTAITTEPSERKYQVHGNGMDLL